MEVGGWGWSGEGWGALGGDETGEGRAGRREPGGSRVRSRESQEGLGGARPGVGRAGGHWGETGPERGELGEAWPRSVGSKAWFWGQQELRKLVPATGEPGLNLGDPGLVLGGQVYLRDRAWGRGLGPAWCFGAGGVPRGVVPFLSPATSSQLTINTAIVYMHRFYMVQSFTQFHRNVSAGGGLRGSLALLLLPGGAGGGSR